MITKVHGGTTGSLAWCWLVAAGCAGLAGLGFPGRAQSTTPASYQLQGMPVGGGGVSTGATHRVVGSIVAFGETMVASSIVIPGGGYELSGSLLGGAAQRLPEVRLSVSRRSDGRFELTWPDVAGFVLETSPAVWPRTDWAPVNPQPADRVLVVTPADLVRYYRLRKL